MIQRAMGWAFEGLIQFPVEKGVEGPSQLRAESELVIRLPFGRMVRAEVMQAQEGELWWVARPGLGSGSALGVLRSHRKPLSGSRQRQKYVLESVWSSGE